MYFSKKLPSWYNAIAEWNYHLMHDIKKLSIEIKLDNVFPFHYFTYMQTCMGQVIAIKTTCTFFGDKI